MHLRARCGAHGKCGRARAHRNFTARRDETLADDLDARPGRVSTRVALLLRGAERQPDVGSFCSKPPHQFGRATGARGPGGGTYPPRERELELGFSPRQRVRPTPRHWRRPLLGGSMCSDLGGVKAAHVLSGDALPMYFLNSDAPAALVTHRLSTLGDCVYVVPPTSTCSARPRSQSITRFAASAT